MHRIIQKLLLLTYLVPLFIGTISVGLNATAAAADNPVGTCFVFTRRADYTQGCKSLGYSSQDKDKYGNHLDFSKYCYIVDVSDTTTIKPATCDGTELCQTNGKIGACKTCNDGLPAPDNDPSKCTTASGGPTQPLPTGDVCGGNTPGHDYASIHTSINFGCRGKGNAIMDLLFAIIRFLTTGVGLVLVASLVWGGIQYTSSRGDPQATAKAIQRIRANVIALLVSSLPTPF